MKLTITEVLDDDYHLDGLMISDVIKSLTNRVEFDNHLNIRFKVMSYQDWQGLQIVGDRLETDEEEKVREDNLNANIVFKENQERKTYEKLKAKYEGLI